MSNTFWYLALSGACVDSITELRHLTPDKALTYARNHPNWLEWARGIGHGYGVGAGDGDGLEFFDGVEFWWVDSLSAKDFILQKIGV
jgi:hypothetical protein